MVGQTRTMLDGYAAGGRYRETVIGNSNVHHGSFGHVPIHTAIHPCGPAGPRTVVSDLAIPARGSLTLSPFGDDVVLRDPAPF